MGSGTECTHIGISQIAVFGKNLEVRMIKPAIPNPVENFATDMDAMAVG